MEKTKFIKNHEIYDTLIISELAKAQKFIWIGTSDIKDFYVSKNNRMVPFLEILSDCVKRKVELRLIHAKEPGEAFRRDFDKFPSLNDGLERLLCPRVHFKCIIIDDIVAYMGSANLTGAGVGAKSKDVRNFEMGILTYENKIISEIKNFFDEIWMGKYCLACKRKKYCADYIDLI